MTARKWCHVGKVRYKCCNLPKVTDWGYTKNKNLDRWDEYSGHEDLVLHVDAVLYAEMQVDLFKEYT